MIRLIGIVVSIGLADSLNPATIAPALYLATGERPRMRVAEFSLGVFVVYFVGGALIALGPGQLLLSLVPKPDAEDRHVIEVVVGSAMIVIALLLWRFRRRLGSRELPNPPVEGRSSAILGATITAIELPTAFPYFAVIAAIVGSGMGLGRQLFLLVLFNVCFVLPLLAIVVSLSVAGPRARRQLDAFRRFLQRRWPVILSALLLLAGIFSVLLGATSFAMHGHGRTGQFFRRVHRALAP